MFTPQRLPRPHYAKIHDELAGMAMGQFDERRQLADLSFLLQGITFTVYSDGRGTERLFPFDLVPRILPRSEWGHIERGLCQRVFALNLVLQDVYGPQRILKDRRIPRSLVYSCQHFRREMIGLQPPGGIYIHIAGIDLVRDSKTGDFLVLEDNVRTPSGISYVLENRAVMTRTFANAFHMHEVLPIAHYPTELCQILRSLSPRGVRDPVIVLLTPGIYNSAYFEHSFLAQQLGVELVDVLDHLPGLVVKAVGESGGYGMLIGPAADSAAIADFRDRLRANPRNYIAQPVIGLSRVPSYDVNGKCLAGRHVDLRPYCLFNGEKVIIVPGGLTRVALQAGSLVVNSSQGGGSKDTWILRGDL